MAEKGGSFVPVHQWRFGLLIGLVVVVVGMVVVWSIDGFNINNIIKSSWQFQQDYNTLPLNSLPNLNHSLANLTSNSTLNTSHSLGSNSTLNTTHYSLGSNSTLNTTHSPLLDKITNSTSTKFNDWISTELDKDFTANLLSRWLAPGGEPCKESETVDIKIPGLDDFKERLVELSAGEIHDFVFQAVDEASNARCLGGDYFEFDLSGDSWKSRPPVQDFAMVLIHFPFRFILILLVNTISLLFCFLDISKVLNTHLQDSHMIDNYDIYGLGSRDVWSGRWTRHAKNDDCLISDDGRFRCLPSDFPCHDPWCNGSLATLESNGWVYSTHCSFRLFSADSAWHCLKNRWIFFWGDSNHVDTIRNMLNFVLDLPKIESVPRRFDMNFSNPKDRTQTVRITSIFNGHWNETQNYLGLDSLKNKGFHNLLKKYFSEDTVPDTIVMNSGLHDGCHWMNIRAFSHGVEYAASFWKDVLESVRQRGLVVPQIIFRSTVASGGYARSLAFNPNKMEVFNKVFLEKLRQAGLVSSVIDNFDMTFSWHFDNRCNDGVHYGRAPLKMKWRDGEIGHQYFVDLMLCHVLLNVLCARY